MYPLHVSIAINVIFYSAHPLEPFLEPYDRSMIEPKDDFVLVYHINRRFGKSWCRKPFDGRKI